MKCKIGVTLALTLVALSMQLHAAERWVPYLSLDTMDVYIDSDSIQVSNGITSYRILMNLKSNARSNARSIISSQEIICSKKLARFVRSNSYTETFGQGLARKVGGDSGKFSPIDGLIEGQFQIVCSK